MASNKQSKRLADLFKTISRANLDPPSMGVQNCQPDGRRTSPIKIQASGGREPKRMLHQTSHPRTVFGSLVIIVTLLIVLKTINCFNVSTLPRIETSWNDEQLKLGIGVELRDDQLANDGPEKLLEQPGQQQFRLLLLQKSPSPRQSSVFSTKLRRRSAPTSSKASQTSPSPMARDVSANQTAGDESSGIAAFQKPQLLATKESLAKMISSTTLKRLLNQTLQNGKHLTTNGRATNGTGEHHLATFAANNQQQQAAIKSSNFKLVFIQRAPANKSDTPTKRKISLASTPPPGEAKLSGSTDNPLASSSWLQTASKNLINAASSLATISPKPDVLSTTRPVASSTTTTTTITSMKPTKSEPTNYDNLIGNELDTRRMSNGPSLIGELDQRSIAINDGAKPKSGVKTKRPKVGGPNRKGRPSRIYKLPIKFVANGQPDNIVLQTFKQHFATIRRLHAASSKMSTKTLPAGTAKNNKLESNGSLKTKLRGTNSRLIYLPLKYLSNARPDIVSSTKALRPEARVQSRANGMA